MNRNVEDKKQLIYNLERYFNRTIFVKFVGGREVAGKLIGFDALQNLVLSNPDSKSNEWIYGKYLICLSSSIISIGLGIPQLARQME